MCACLHVCVCEFVWPCKVQLFPCACVYVLSSPPRPCSDHHAAPPLPPSAAERPSPRKPSPAICCLLQLSNLYALTWVHLTFHPDWPQHRWSCLCLLRFAKRPSPTSCDSAGSVVWHGGRFLSGKHRYWRPCCSWMESELGQVVPLAGKNINNISPSGVCLLADCLTSQQHASVSQGRICTHNFTCCHTEIEFADQTSTSPSHSIMTPGRPVPALTLQCQAPGREAAGVPIFKLLIWLDPEKSHRKRDSNPGSSAPEVNASTSRPARRFHLEANWRILWEL